MAFNAYLIFDKDSKISGESTSNPDPNNGWKKNRALEITDYGFGVNMPVTTSRSDGGGATTIAEIIDEQPARAPRKRR